MEGSGKALHALAQSAAAARATGYAPLSAWARDCGSSSNRVVLINNFPTDARTRAVAAAPREPTAHLQGQRGWSIEEEEMEEGRYRRAFGPTPSEEEVTEAITAIRQIFCPVTISRIFEDGSSSASNPEMKLYNTKTIESQKVIDAFCSLHTNPSIQRMVTSLSSDKAVWDAVVKNEAVKELRESFYGVERTKMKKVDTGSNVIEMILDWILDLAKTKILEIFDHIWRIGSDVCNRRHMVNASFKGNASFGDVVRSSFMLSVVVFMVVVALRLWRGK